MADDAPESGMDELPDDRSPGKSRPLGQQEAQGSVSSAEERGRGVATDPSDEEPPESGN